MKLYRGFCSLLFCCLLCGLLVACQSGPSSDVQAEIDCYMRWTDTQGKSHCDHDAISQVIWTDTTYTDTARINVVCRDSSCVDSTGAAKLYTVNPRQRWGKLR